MSENNLDDSLYNICYGSPTREEIESRIRKMKAALEPTTPKYVDSGFDVPVNEEQLKRLWNKGIDAWKGVPSATDWVEELRGHPVLTPQEAADMAACAEIERQMG